MSTLLSLGRFRARQNEAGWMAMSFNGDELDYAHCRYVPKGKSAVTRCGSLALANADSDSGRASRPLQLDRYQCSTVLPHGDYQLLLVDAPKVAPTELKTAIRWHVKGMLDYHIDDATIDVLDIPVDPARSGGAHSMYAVAAKNDKIKACIDRFEAAHIPLSVIDVPETAQRNIASLYEVDDRGVAMLYLGREQGLLTISRGGELYLARRLDVAMEKLRDATNSQRQDLFDRIVLELQRTFDHFDRQFGYVRVAKVMVGPEPVDTGLAAFLAANLDLQVEGVRLAEVMDFADGVAPDAETQWRLFHLLGAGLRHESKAL